MSIPGGKVSKDISRPKTGNIHKNIGGERTTEFAGRMAPGSIGAPFRPGTMIRNDTYVGSRRMTGATSNNMRFGAGFRQPNKMADEIDKFMTVQARKKNESIEYSILQQIDKTYVLCIDPETRLPFMVNMDLKMADICDLDNRPKHIKERQRHPQEDADDNASEYESEYSVEESYRSRRNPSTSQAQKPAILDVRQYPFYHKVKRSLYMIEQLLDHSNRNNQSLDEKKFDEPDDLEASGVNNRGKSQSPARDKPTLQLPAQSGRGKT